MKMNKGSNVRCRRLKRIVLSVGCAAAVTMCVVFPSCAVHAQSAGAAKPVTAAKSAGETAGVATAGDAALAQSDDAAVTSGLAIDGYFAEWTQYPSADITYNGNNSNSVHKGQLAIEGDRLYVHFSMSDLYTSQMQFQMWNITVGGRSCVLNILPVNDDGGISWDGSKLYNVGEGIHKGYGVFAGYYNDVDGDAAFTVYDATHQQGSKGDEIEFSLSLDKLADCLGIDIDRSTTITVSNPNIGARGVTITGTPTGPWLGAASALLIAAAGVYAAMRRKRRAS